MGKKKKKNHSHSSSGKHGGKRKSTSRNKPKKNRSKGTTEAEDFQFRQSLEEGGSRTVIEMSADGNCLFRSISDQLYHDYGNMHDEVRKDVTDYMEQNEDEFSVFLVLDETEEDEDAANFEAYVCGMREDGEWGGNLELVAAARIYRRNIKVFLITGSAFTIEHGEKNSEGPDMLVSYHDNDHYNSVRDNSLPRPPNPGRFLENNRKENREEKSAGTKAAASDDQTDKCETVSPEESLRNGKKKRAKTNVLKMKDPCECGSGLQYKKCCSAAKKRKEKLRKWKATNGIEESVAVGCDSEESIMDGNFKVLKI